MKSRKQSRGCSLDFFCFFASFFGEMIIVSGKGGGLLAEKRGRRQDG
nr:MAG TPA: hypothetical protein [Caudoviricetes sp.]